MTCEGNMKNNYSTRGTDHEVINGINICPTIQNLRCHQGYFLSHSVAKSSSIPVNSHPKYILNGFSALVPQ